MTTMILVMYTLLQLVEVGVRKQEVGDMENLRSSAAVGGPLK
jgi:hypothetical protein